MPGGKSLVLLVGGKERRHGVGRVLLGRSILDTGHQILKAYRLGIARVAGRPHRYENVGILREYGMLFVQLQGVHEPLPQSFQEEERAS